MKKLLQQCSEEGILTEDPIRKYPLTLSNLHVVLKIYAINTFQPYTYTLEKGIPTTYYLTDKGLEMFYEFFRTHTFTFSRSLFSHILMHAKEDFDPVTFKDFSNFRGTDGLRTVAGSKQKALVIRTVARCKRQFPFDSIKDARDALRIWLTQYPIEEFKLYRIREQKGYTFKEEIPLIVERKATSGSFKPRGD